MKIRTLFSICQQGDRRSAAGAVNRPARGIRRLTFAPCVFPFSWGPADLRAGRALYPSRAARAISIVVIHPVSFFIVPLHRERKRSCCGILVAVEDLAHAQDRWWIFMKATFHVCSRWHVMLVRTSALRK